MSKLNECFRKYKNKILLITPQFEEGLTYGQIDHMSLRMANILENEGIIENDKVIVLLDSNVEHVLVNYALLKLRAVPVPINAYITKNELQYIVNDCRPKRIICQKSALEREYFGLYRDIFLCMPSYNDLLNLRIEGDTKQYIFHSRNDEDLILILYTSGSTGKPKGVLMKYNGWLESADKFGNLSYFDSETRIFQIMPLYHATGWFTSLIVPVMFGASVVIIEQFGIKKLAKFWNYVEKFAANYLITVPSVLSSLLLLSNNRKQQNYPNIKYVNCSSAALLPEIRKAFEEKFRVKIIEDYSSTEAGIISITPPSLDNVSVGRLSGISDVKINDDGEILVKNGNVFAGYLNKPELTESSFTGEWFKTGDVGYMKDGFLYLIGRKDDIINKNGGKISPKEIDNVLMRYKRVIKESFTFGYKNEDSNDDIYSVIVLEKNELFSEDKTTKRDIFDYCRKNLSLEKIPNKIIFVDDIPKNSTGKPSKKEVLKIINNK